MQPDKVEAAETVVQAQIRSRSRSVHVVPSTAWHEKTFASAASWDDWVWKSVVEVEYATRKPHFDGFIACTKSLGRANAAIVELALRQNRPVLAISDDDRLVAVTSVMVDDPEDWMGGWSVRTNN